MGYQETYNYIAKPKDKEIILNLLKRYGMYSKRDMFASLYGIATMDKEAQIGRKKYPAGSQFFLLIGDRPFTELKQILLTNYKLKKKEEKAIRRTITVAAEDMDKYYGICNLKEVRLKIPPTKHSNLLP